MQTYQPNQKGPLKITGYVDPDDRTIVTVFWGAKNWDANTVYRIGDVMCPSTDNGYYYQCTNNGVSGLNEPIWTQDEITWGECAFIAIPWDLWVLPDQYITNSVWVSDSGISLSNTYHTAVSTTATIEPFANTITQFEISNQVTKNNGEMLSRSFLYKTNQQ